jgi:serine/threonine-protein kinase
VENSQIGPFFILKKLGSHRRHQVFQARQTEQDRDVALKFIKIPKNVDRAKALQKIQFESEILKALSHPNLVKFYGAGIEGDRIFFASKLIKGESLATILTRRSKLTPELVIDYAKQIASCLQYLHEHHLVHSKLTPDKILVDRRGVLRIADLRLNRARKKRWDDAPRRGHLEIAAYLAPEVLTGKGATEKSDFYSLGVIMYEMLAGELPFEPDSMHRMMRIKKTERVGSVAEKSLNCPVWLDQIVQRLLEPNPKNRPHLAESIILELKEIKAFHKLKKSTVAQLSDVLKPLSKITDRVEADKILGTTEPQEKRVPFFQSAPFLAICLVILLGLITIAAWPQSNEKLFAEAQVLMQSSDSADWRRAQQLLAQIAKRERGDELTEDAAEQQLAVRRKLLIDRAESGQMISQSGPTRDFVRAFEKEKDGQYESALKTYRQLMDQTRSNTMAQHIFLESQSRSDEILQRIGVIEDKADKIDQMIFAARQAILANEIEQARKILESVIESYSLDPDVKQWVKRAQYELVRISS